MDEQAYERSMVWAILEAAERGNVNYLVAQTVASLIASGGLDARDAIDTISEIVEAIRELLFNQELIWDGLMPGPGGGKSPMPEPIADILKLIGSNRSKDNKLDDVTDYLIENGWTALSRSKGNPDSLDSDLGVNPHRVTMVRKINENDWLAFEHSDGEADHKGWMWIARPEFYRNVSHPRFDELQAGHVIMIPEEDLRPVQATALGVGEVE